MYQYPRETRFSWKRIKRFGKYLDERSSSFHFLKECKPKSHEISQECDSSRACETVCPRRNRKLPSTISLTIYYQTRFFYFRINVFRMIYLGEIIELRENDISFNLDISIIRIFEKLYRCIFRKKKKSYRESIIFFSKWVTFVEDMEIQPRISDKG